MAFKSACLFRALLIISSLGFSPWKINMTQRFRIRFAKKGDLIFLSHLDLVRLFERAVRRAELPVSMTKGFNPHPRISFPLALALGVESLDEVVEMDLDSWLTAREVKERLSAQLPCDIQIKKVELIPPGLSGKVKEVSYLIKLSEDKVLRQQDIDRLLSRKEVPVERRRGQKTKVVDIRPMLLEASSSGRELSLRLRVTPSGSVRPEDFLRAVGLSSGEIRRCHILRTRLLID